MIEKPEVVHQILVKLRIPLRTIQSQRQFPFSLLWIEPDAHELQEPPRRVVILLQSRVAKDTFEPALGLIERRRVDLIVRQRQRSLAHQTSRHQIRSDFPVRRRGILPDRGEFRFRLRQIARVEMRCSDLIGAVLTNQFRISGRRRSRDGCNGRMWRVTEACGAIRKDFVLRRQPLFHVGAFGAKPRDAAVENLHRMLKRTGRAVEIFKVIVLCRHVFIDSCPAGIAEIDFRLGTGHFRASGFPSGSLRRTATSRRR